MNENKEMMENNKQTKFHVKIKSAVHPNVNHTIEIDLRCYEQMPEEKKLQKPTEKQKNIIKKNQN